MKSSFVAQSLIALALTALLPVALAVQESPRPKEPSGGIVTPKLTEPQPKSESKPVVPAAVDTRGQLLYENHCRVCHTSIVHVRESHRARSLNDLEYWVKRWSGELKLPWSASEVSDVVDYLNQSYYKIGATPDPPK